MKPKSVEIICGATALIIAVAILGVRLPASGNRTVTIATTGYSGGTYLPIAYAFEKGIFRDHGINVTLIPMKDFYTAMLAFSAGQVDVVSQSPGIAAVSLAQGDRFKIGMSLRTADDLILIAKPSITEVNQLRGKTLATSGRNSDAYRTISWYLEGKGMDIEQHIQVVEIKSPATMVTGFETGQLDAIIVSAGYAARAMASGGRPLVSCSDAFREISGHPLHAPLLLISEKLLEREQMARQFLRAMRKACSEVDLNRDEAARIWASSSNQALDDIIPIMEMTHMVGDLDEDVREDIMAFFEWGLRKGCFEQIPGEDVFYDDWR